MLTCQALWIQPKTMIITAPILFALFVLADIFIYMDEIDKQKVLSASEKPTNFFARLSNIARKRMIAEEHYRRTHYGISMLDDKAYEQMKRTPGQDYQLEMDPPCYDILLNKSEQRRMLYQPLFMTERDSEQWKISDQIIRALFSNEIPHQHKQTI